MVDRRAAPRGEREGVGLCCHCQHLEIRTSDRASVFYFCRRSNSDPAFPKYPRLPVIECSGYESRDGDPAAGVKLEDS
jgi:hypothetical protein